MSLNDWSAEDVAQALSGEGRSRAKRTGQGYMVCCPAHDDRSPSCSIKDGRNGVLLYFCFAGCTQEAVKAALEDRLGVEPYAEGGQRKERKKRIINEEPIDPIEVIVPAPEDAVRGTADDFYHFEFGLPSRVWTYRLADGLPAGWIARYERPGGGKEIVPWSWTKDSRNGKCELRMKALPPERPLYNLDQIAVRIHDPILWVEGEKAADAATEMFPGWIATTTSGGGNAINLHDLSPLYGRIVVILPDHDGPGYLTGAQLADKLLGRCDLRQIVWPTRWPDGRPYSIQDKDDAADHKERGWTAEKLRACIDQGHRLYLPLREIASPFDLIHYDSVAERKFARQ